MKCPLATAVAFVCGICLPACDKQEAGPPAQARATPSPTPKDELDAGTNPLKARAAGALAAVENYLVGHSPRLREKYARDKARWRERLLREQKELQPQIEQLEAQLAQVNTEKTRDEIRAELTRLNDQSKDAALRLQELEAATQAAWKSFKVRLKTEEAKNATPSPHGKANDGPAGRRPGANASPTPST